MFLDEETLQSKLEDGRSINRELRDPSEDFPLEGKLLVLASSDSGKSGLIAKCDRIENIGLYYDPINMVAMRDLFGRKVFIQKGESWKLLPEDFNLN